MSAAGKAEARILTAIAAVLAASTFIIPHFPTVERVITTVFAVAVGLELLYLAWIVVRDLYL